MLDTLVWLRHETEVWVEITTLLIPGENDSDEEIAALSRWVMAELGPDVPVHFTAFHPDFKLKGHPPTPLATVRRARRIALEAGLHHVYTGNVRDPEGATAWCAGCGQALIVRDGYRLLDYQLDGKGACPTCGTHLAGHFDTHPGDFGNRRIPVFIGDHAAGTDEV